MEPTLKIDRAAYEVLEEPMIRVPYELMRRNHRAAQRLVEREFNGLSVSRSFLMPITHAD